MAYPYRIHEKAHEEYIEAYLWYELEKARLGDQFMDSVEKKLQQISEHPEFYSRKHNLRFREAKVDRFPYMIVYEFFPRKKFIHVAAICHQRRSTRGRYRKMK
jgi:plasmid stabilization system protein ParE